MFGRQSMAIDSERTMTYRDQKNYSLSCVHSSYEIREMEAQRYLEALDEKVKQYFPNADDVENQRNSSQVVDNYMGSLDSKGSGSLNKVNKSTEGGLYGLPDITTITLETLTDNKYRTKLKQMKDECEKFTREWNGNEKNRDQTIAV